MQREFTKATLINITPLTCTDDDIVICLVVLLRSFVYGWGRIHLGRKNRRIRLIRRRGEDAHVPPQELEASARIMSKADLLIYNLTPINLRLFRLAQVLMPLGKGLIVHSRRPPSTVTVTVAELFWASSVGKTGKNSADPSRSHVSFPQGMLRDKQIIGMRSYLRL